MFETFKTKEYPELDPNDFKKCKTQKERGNLLHKRLEMNEEIHTWNQRAINNQMSLFWIIPIGIIIGVAFGLLVFQIYSYYRP